jgi:hypothetical protein
MRGRGQVNVPKAMNALAIDHHRILFGHCTGDAGSIDAICVLCFVTLVRRKGAGQKDEPKPSFN